MKDSQLLWVGLILLVLLFPLGGGILGPAPPFATDQPRALVVEETEQRTMELTTAFKAMQDQLAAGNYRQLDKDNSPDLDAQWVKDAWAVWVKAGKNVPWVVGASKSHGINQAVPTDPAQAATLIQGLGK